MDEMQWKVEKRLLNVWKTKVPNCGLVLYFQSAVHVDTLPCLRPYSGLQIALAPQGRLQGHVFGLHIQYFPFI